VDGGFVAAFRETIAVSFYVLPAEAFVVSMVTA
jgi:hypothetical protein